MAGILLSLCLVETIWITIELCLLLTFFLTPVCQFMILCCHRAQDHIFMGLKSLGWLGHLGGIQQNVKFVIGRHHCDCNYAGLDPRPARRVWTGWSFTRIRSFICEKWAPNSSKGSLLLFWNFPSGMNKGNILWLPELLQLQHFHLLKPAL